MSMIGKCSRLTPGIFHSTGPFSVMNVGYMKSENPVPFTWSAIGAMISMYEDLRAIRVLLCDLSTGTG